MPGVSPSTVKPSGSPGALGVGSPVAWVAVLCAGTFGALPKVWVIGGVRLIGSTRAAVAMTVEPLVAVGVAALLLRQWLTPVELAGGALILVAVILVQLPAAAPRSRRVAPADDLQPGAP